MMHLNFQFLSNLESIGKKLPYLSWKYRDTRDISSIRIKEMFYR